VSQVEHEETVATGAQVVVVRVEHVEQQVLQDGAQGAHSGLALVSLELTNPQYNPCMSRGAVVKALLNSDKGPLVVAMQAQRTVGGGKFLDLRAPSRKRRTPERLAQLQARAISDPEGSLAALLEIPPHYVELSTFARDRALNSSRRGGWRSIDDWMCARHRDVAGSGIDAMLDLGSIFADDPNADEGLFADRNDAPLLGETQGRDRAVIARVPKPGTAPTRRCAQRRTANPVAADQSRQPLRQSGRGRL
jgi:hypothetical protein